VSAALLIRPYRETDRAEFTRVWCESSSSTFPDEPRPPGLYDELFARLPREIAAGWTVFVAEVEDRIVGLLAYTAATRHLNQLFVDPGCQSRRIGKMLLEKAKSDMADGFWLRTAVRNLRARRFYEREGLQHKEDAPHPNHPQDIFSVYDWKP
jgi:GNAT superfamily N-acetyltransferase